MLFDEARCCKNYNFLVPSAYLNVALVLGIGVWMFEVHSYQYPLFFSLLQTLKQSSSAVPPPQQQPAATSQQPVAAVQPQVTPQAQATPPAQASNASKVCIHTILNDFHNSLYKHQQ